MGRPSSAALVTDDRAAGNVFTKQKWMTFGRERKKKKSNDPLFSS